MSEEGMLGANLLLLQSCMCAPSAMPRMTPKRNNKGSFLFVPFPPEIRNSIAVAWWECHDSRDEFEERSAWLLLL